MNWAVEQERAFFQVFPIRDALRHELSWTHYRTLLQVESEQARRWYMDETAAHNWSSRALEWQIGTLYYERLLASRDRAPRLRAGLLSLMCHLRAVWLRRLRYGVQRGKKYCFYHK